MSRANSHEPLRLLLPGYDGVTGVGIEARERSGYRIDCRCKLKLVVRCMMVKESSNTEKSSDGRGRGEWAGFQDGRMADGWMAHALFAALECFGHAHEVIANVT